MLGCWGVLAMYRNDGLAVRKKQVAALQAYFQNTVREVRVFSWAFAFSFSTSVQITPDAVYEIVVAAPGRAVVRVTVTLPEQFPYQPPVIQCVPPIMSPHADSNGYVRSSAHEGLLRWNVQNNLGKVVYEVVAGVVAPAAPAAASAAPVSAGPAPQAAPYPPPPQYGSISGTGPASAVGSFAIGKESPTVAPRKPPAVEVPAIPVSFPEIDGKSAEELQRLVSDESELFLLLEDVEFYKGLNRLRDMSRDANVAQAEKNLARKPELDAAQRQLETMARELETLKQNYNEKLAKQKSLTQLHTPQALARMLEAETNKLDADTEDLSQRFLAGQMSLKEYLAAYLEKRTLYHQRAAKLESIKDAV